MSEEKECWTCGRTESVLKAMIPDYEDMVKLTEFTWLETHRGGVFVCPICREVKLELEIDKAFINYIDSLFDEFFEELLPKLKIKQQFVIVETEDS